jgi:drug/metabolite transporter (DMT)-like permease
MDFGIGASARQAGWFLPVVWTRTYSLLLLTLVFTWMHRRARPRSSYTSIRLWRRHVLGAGLRDTSTFSQALSRFGLLLASAAGVVENAAVILFSIDTTIAQMGIASILAANYSLVAMLFGFLAFHERLERHQLLGLALVLGGLSLLALG